MESESTNNRSNRNVDWSRFGLGPESATRARSNTSGFVDLGNEYEFGAGGHQASGANELFAEEQVILRMFTIHSLIVVFIG